MITEQSKRIFHENYIGSIATVNPDGTPWSSPVHLVADSEYIYWLSKPDKQHSQNVERTADVHVTLFSPDVTRGLQGVYVSGQAEHLPAQDQPRVYQLMRARVGHENMPRGMEQADAYRVRIGVENVEKSTGNCWYFYSQKD